MLQNLLNTFIKLCFAVLALGLTVALFLIGIVALWYFLLIGMVLWLGRRLYLAWKTRHSGPVQLDGVEIIVHEERSTKSSRAGRVIEHE